MALPTGGREFIIQFILGEIFVQLNESGLLCYFIYEYAIGYGPILCWIFGSSPAFLMMGRTSADLQASWKTALRKTDTLTLSCSDGVRTSRQKLHEFCRHRVIIACSGLHYQAIHPTGICHFVRYSREILKEETNFRNNLAWKHDSSSYCVQNSFAKSSAFKLYLFHFIGQLYRFLAFWKDKRQSPSGLFLLSPSFIIFFSTRGFSSGRGRKKKYPRMTHDYQSVDMPGMYYAGTLAHYLDFRKSAGGFVHGFRYTSM